MKTYKEFAAILRSVPNLTREIWARKHGIEWYLVLCKDKNFKARRVNLRKAWFKTL